MDKIPLPGSERQEQPRSRRVDVSSPEECFTISIILRPRSSNGERFPQQPDRRTLSREEFAAVHGADPEDIAKIEAFAKENKLSVTGIYPARRTVELSGTVADFSKAFQLELALYESEGQKFRDHAGPIYLPPELVPLVQAIFGLDNQPIGRSLTSDPIADPLTPLQVAAAYGFPTEADGTGQTIGIVALDGGYLLSDLSKNSTTFEQPAPTTIDVSSDGTINNQNSLSKEVSGDLMIASLIAPGARFVVYFAQQTAQGLQAAISTALNDSVNSPSVISISYSLVESRWRKSDMLAIDGFFQQAANHNITILVGSGNNGSSAGQPDGLAHVEFPASSPNVTACGGTIFAHLEVAWNTSGGGVSDFFPLPDYQIGAGVPPSANPGAHIGRGVPDVSGFVGNYIITFQNALALFRGTSAVPPLWASLLARINQIAGAPIGFLNPILYGRLAPAGALSDITSGTNGAYASGPGWDACTGLGSPLGIFIARLLAPPSVTGVFPSAGPAGGGTPVTINGSRFIGATSVNFTNAPLDPLFTVVSDTQISVVGTPAVAAAVVINGPVDVKVTSPSGTSTPSPVDQFTYFFTIPNITSILPSSGSTSGNDSVSILGSGFTGATSVQFGDTTFPQGSFIFNSDGSIAVITPAVDIPRPVDVTVTAAGVMSAPFSFTYQ